MIPARRPRVLRPPLFVAEMDGGLAVAAEGRIPGRLPLPLGGLMTVRPMAEVKGQLHEPHKAARALGAGPIMTRL